MKNEQGLRELIIAELRPRIPQYYCKDIKLQKIAGAIITVLKPYLALTEQASPQMMSKIDDVMKIQLADPSTKKDPYMQGLANGMIMIKSIITGDEPKFITIPKPQTEKYICLTCQRKHTDADCPDRNNRIECDKYQPKPQAEPDRCDEPKPYAYFGCHPVWLEIPKRWIWFCNKCGEYVTKDTGCSNPFCPERINDGQPILGKEKEHKEIETTNQFRTIPPENLEQVHYAFCMLADKVDELVKAMNEMRGR
jgi:hypothetical protein